MHRQFFFLLLNRAGYRVNEVIRAERFTVNFWKTGLDPSSGLYWDEPIIDKDLAEAVESAYKKMVDKAIENGLGKL